MPISKTIASLCVAAAIAAGCATEANRNIYPAHSALLAQMAEYERLHHEHRIILASEDEPGRRLMILGLLVRAESALPIPDQEIMLYHADHNGSYDESVPGYETTARIGGTVRTDSRGRFMISTVLPGDYGSTPHNRHVHTTVGGADPEGYDFYFRQFINVGLLSWAESSDQAVLIDLMEGPSGALIGTAHLPVKSYQD